MNRRRAFTLIELLTVIAIIAVLAAIILPVLARAKDNAYRNADISNMNAIRTALQLYRVDQGAYPPALLGYATLYTSGPNMGQVMPANAIKGFLYPRRIGDLNTLRPAYNRIATEMITTAVWPNQDPRAIGTAPTFDSNGDGNITPLDDIAGARQRFGIGDTVLRGRLDPGGVCTTVNSEFYGISGYDVAQIPAPGGTRTEIRYALFWTRFATPADPCNPQIDEVGSAFDDPRQLGYDDPPENTVVTWSSHFRDWDGTAPVRNRRDLVLMLGGAARPTDSVDMHQRSWRHLP